MYRCGAVATVEAGGTCTCTARTYSTSTVQYVIVLVVGVAEDWSRGVGDGWEPSI
jgi:hypothetical protein